MSNNQENITTGITFYDSVDIYEIGVQSQL